MSGRSTVVGGGARTARGVRPAVARGSARGGWFAAWVALVCAVVFACAGTAGAEAPAADGPGDAVVLGTVTAENGTVNDLSAVVDPAGATPDGGIARCFGADSFERSVWAWVPAAEGASRVTVEVTAQDAQGAAIAPNAQPDLALFVQSPGGTRELPDVREPAACDARELLGDGARGDAGSAATVVVGAGRPVLAQIAWRGSDPSAPLVVSAHREPLALPAAPAGDEPASAPAVALGGAVGVPTAGATLGPADPAQPWCAAPATVWRRVAVPRAGYYAVAAAGGAAALTVFSEPISGDGALACVDAGDGDPLALSVRAPAAGTLWLRVGVDRPERDAGASLATSGPFPDGAAATAALPAATAKAASLAPAGCTTASRPKALIAPASLAALRARRTRTLSGTVQQPCDALRGRAKAVRVGVARRTATKCVWLKGRRFAPRASRCATVAGARTARGVTRWRVTLPRRLSTGTFRVAVQLRVVKPGAKKATTATAVVRTITIKKQAKP